MTNMLIRKIYCTSSYLRIQNQKAMLRSKSMVEISSEASSGLRRSASVAAVDGDLVKEGEKETKENSFMGKMKRSVRFVADQFSSISLQSTDTGCLTFKLLPPPDCLVQVMNMIFECNKEVLSQYLDINRFPLCSSVPVILDTEKIVSPEVFWWVYNWMNAEEGREKFINVHWALQLYIAGLHLGIQELWERSYEFLMDPDQVAEESAFLLLRRAHRFARPDLQEHFASQITESFLPLSSSDDLYELFWEELVLILQSNNIVVTGEVEVLYAAMFWMEDDEERKINFLDQLMSTVRFHLMPVSQILSVAVEFPELVHDRDVRSRILEAIKLSTLRDAGHLDFDHPAFINTRRMPYKPVSQQPRSYEEFLVRGRRARVINKVYDGDSVRVERCEMVREMRRIWEMEKTKARMAESLRPRPRRSHHARQMSF